jgi:crotonobetainyl-CoA:carnitine CoA-transferase CaiB-like acyl-CoA transferase
VTVLELGSFISAPFAGRILADFGARVIKVEPLQGDALRQWGQIATQENSYWSLSQSRGKELVAIDLHQDEGQRLVRDLAGKADVVLENFRPGRLAEWGLDRETLAALYPKLIMVSISGFGQTGPYRERAGFGNIAESMGGLRSVTGYEDSPPLRVGVSLGDQIASLYAVIGTLLALRERDHESPQRGEHVDVSLFESVLSMMEASVAEYVHRGVVPRRLGNRLYRSAPSGVYPTQDGQWVAIGANADSIFQRFAKAIGRADWLADPGYGSNAGRLQHADDLDEGIVAYTRTRRAAEVLEVMEAAKVPAGPVYSVREIAGDPHLRARRAVTEVACPDLHDEPVTMLGVFPRLTERPGAIRTPGGAIGRDTAAVLGELLGISPEEQAELQRRGVIRMASRREEVMW